MQNEKSKRIQQLRNDAADVDRTLKDRLKSGERLLSEFGPTGRNIPFLNLVIREGLKDQTYDNQLRAQKLKDKLLKAKGLVEVGEAELPEEADTATIEEAMPTIIAGVSASEVPTSSSLTIDGIRHVVRKFAGVLSNERPPDLTALSIERQNLIIEALVHATGRCLSVLDIQLVIDELNRTGASNFPGLIQVAQRYLEVTRNV